MMMTRRPGDQVGNYQIRTEAVKHAERFVGRLDSLDVVTFGAQANTQEPQEPRIIIDKKDFPQVLWLFGCHVAIILHPQTNVKESTGLGN